MVIRFARRWQLELGYRYNTGWETGQLVRYLFVYIRDTREIDYICFFQQQFEVKFTELLWAFGGHSLPFPPVLPSFQVKTLYNKVEKRREEEKKGKKNRFPNNSPPPPNCEPSITYPLHSPTAHLTKYGHPFLPLIDPPCPMGLPSLPCAVLPCKHLPHPQE
jgi:hypothetical protein